LWGWLTLAGVRMFTIAEQRDETPVTRTIIFEERLSAVPGQFVMVWVPGVDEFPMSVSYATKDFGITYQVVGPGTKALAGKQVGDMIGIRGPYGKGFTIHGKKLLMVAGGLGMAPLAPFIEESIEHKATVDLVLGAKTANELLFEGRAADAGASVHVSTDDGSKGFKGLATQLAAVELEGSKFDCIYACGPERMIVGILGISENCKTPMQASLERIMKCGIGICDSCAIDGRHVCKDGPVFSERELRSFEDLGKTKLDTTGRKVPV
jgi:dihydroorotate dehydrogenase electron transfer subunit